MRSCDLKSDSVSETWAFQRFELMNSLRHPFVSQFERRSTLAPGGLICVIYADRLLCGTFKKRERTLVLVQE